MVGPFPLSFLSIVPRTNIGEAYGKYAFLADRGVGHILLKRFLLLLHYNKIWGLCKTIAARVDAAIYRGDAGRIHSSPELNRFFGKF